MHEQGRASKAPRSCGTTTVLRRGALRFYFDTGQEPKHVHVAREDSLGKIWLRPATVAWTVGFTHRDVKQILAIVQDHRKELEQSWNQYFNR